MKYFRELEDKGNMSTDAVSESPEHVLTSLDRILPVMAEDNTSPGVLSQVSW